MGAFSLQVPAGLDIGTDVGFFPTACIVSNYTGYYIYLPDGLNYCPPWTSGAIIPLAHATRARATWSQSPFGPQTIVAIPNTIQQASLTFTDNENLQLGGGTSIPQPVTIVVPTLSGVVFPASPGLYDQFFRTDIGGTFYYDGTQWVSNFARPKLVEILIALNSGWNDWNPTGLVTAGLITINPSLSINITGIAAQPSGTELWLFNLSGVYNINLIWESSFSVGSNRFASKNSTSTVMAPYSSVRLVYSGLVSRWIVLQGA